MISYQIHRICLNIVDKGGIIFCEGGRNWKGVHLCLKIWLQRRTVKESKNMVCMGLGLIINIKSTDNIHNGEQHSTRRPKISVKL